MLIPLLVIGIAASACVADDEPIVNTDYGKIQGFLTTSSKNQDYFTFHNIPFAKPPTGELRFKNPERADSWDGVRSGLKTHSICPQSSIFEKNNMGNYTGAEDCLYLTVYTPKIDGNPIPVMVFLHGGGFFIGAGNHYGGSDLVDENVVMVSVNYRLGILGFLSTEDGIIPGNLGLKDQTMAMEWVKENIDQFGGNPDQVTLFGESAGAASVHYHILSPSSKGLFHRAIIQSGTVLCPWASSKGHKNIAHQVGAAVGCFTPSEIGKQQSRRLLECLQKVDEETLCMTYEKFIGWSFFPFNFNPYVDGEFLPDEPETLLRNGNYNPVDIIIGINKDEGALFAKSAVVNKAAHAKLHDDFDYYGPVSLGLSDEANSDELGRKVYNHYLDKVTMEESDFEEINQMFGDRHFKICSDIVAQIHKGKVYLYEFEYKGSISLTSMIEGDLGDDAVSHGDELLYLFPTKILQSVGFQFKKPELNEADKQMKDIMTKLWTNFAKNGNPTPDDSMNFKWEPYSKQSPKQLFIDLSPEMKEYPRTKVGEFWSELPTLQNLLLYGPANADRADKTEL